MYFCRNPDIALSYSEITLEILTECGFDVSSKNIQEDKHGKAFLNSISDVYRNIPIGFFDYCNFNFYMALF